MLRASAQAAGFATCPTNRAALVAMCLISKLHGRPDGTSTGDSGVAVAPASLEAAERLGVVCEAALALVHPARG